MIARLAGTVVHAAATHAIVDVGGVGLRVECTPATAATLRHGEQAHLATSLVVREDSLTLYGFSADAEREAFELVQTASGVGPRLAMAVVSVLSPEDLAGAIAEENISALTAVPGIGPKGARKMVIELKDKVAALGVLPAPTPAAGGEEWREQVAEGLEGLGWSAKDARRACDAVEPWARENPQASVAVLMRAALRALAP